MVSRVIFSADRRVAFDPPINLSADFGDQKAVPAQANEIRHLQDTEHRPSNAHRQHVGFAASILFALDFLCDCCQPERLPMGNQHAKDEHTAILILAHDSPRCGRR